MTKTSKTAIVTGGSRGIGAAIAERLARDGFGVVVNYSGNEAAATETLRRIEAARGQACHRVPGRCGRCRRRDGHVRPRRGRSSAASMC